MSHSPTNSPCELRVACLEDIEYVGDLHASVFGPGRFARTAFRIRERVPAHLHRHIVALSDGEIVGAVLLIPVAIGDQQGAWLGPICVSDEAQMRGVGSQLMDKAKELAIASDCQFIGLVGDPPFYLRHGFVAADAARISLPGPVDPNRVLICLLAGSKPPFGPVIATTDDNSDAALDGRLG